jgi:tRNA-modifying protein YgfZ
MSHLKLFNRSACGQLLLRGPDVPMFLGNLSTNDFKNLPLGAGCPGFFCNPLAKAMFWVAGYHILHEGAHAIWLTTEPGRAEALFKHLDRYLISEAVEIEDVTQDYSQWHIAGPEAKATLDSLFQESLPDLQPYQHLTRALGTYGDISIRARQPLGTLGFDLVFHRTLTEVLKSTMNFRHCSDAEYEQLRIEAGTPAYGQDWDETRFVMEIGGAPAAVSYTKGCYLGQEPIVMSRDRAGHAPRVFVQLHVTSAVPGDKILAGNEDIGQVTSVSGSTALGYVRWKHREPGNMVQIQSQSATVQRVLSED